MFGNYYFQFINNIPQKSLFHQGEYHPGLVILSLAIAIFTSYTAFLMGQFAEPVTSKQIRYALLSLSGLASVCTFVSQWLSNGRWDLGNALYWDVGFPFTL
jgi:hypothetical protein